MTTGNSRLVFNAALPIGDKAAKVVAATVSLRSAAVELKAVLDAITQAGDLPMNLETPNDLVDIAVVSNGNIGATNSAGYYVYTALSAINTALQSIDTGLPAGAKLANLDQGG